MTDITAGQGHALPLTGERTVPGIAEENYWFRRHEAAYLALLPHCRDAVVLEAGCGEGYGADLLARDAAAVVGLDYDAPTAAHVARAYPAVRVLRGNLAALPLRSSTVDVVANLQVIEHLWDQEGFLAECARVLRPGGRLLVTTPNRITFSPGRDTPLNPFHTRELAPSEMDSLLTGAGFAVEYLGGLSHGPRLAGAGRGVRRLDHRRAGAGRGRRRAVAGRPARRGRRRRGGRLRGGHRATSSPVWTSWPWRGAHDARARSAWCCTATCPGSPTTARGRSARSGSTRRGRTRTCRSSTCVRRLGEEGRTDLLTLGVTPVLAAQLDDPYALRVGARLARQLAAARAVRGEPVARRRPAAA